MAARDPQIRRDPTQEVRLEPHTLAQLGKLKLTLQIIVFALVMGVVIFLAVVLGMIDKPTTFLGPDTQWIMLILAGVALPPAVIVPSIIRRLAVKQVPQGASSLLNGEPRHDEAILAALRLQNATIVGCALLEGPAFANVFALMQSGDQVHLLVAGLLVLGIVAWFPTSSRHAAAVERALEDRRVDAELEK